MRLKRAIELARHWATDKASRACFVERRIQIIGEVKKNIRVTWSFYVSRIFQCRVKWYKKWRRKGNEGKLVHFTRSFLIAKRSLSTRGYYYSRYWNLKFVSFCLSVQRRKRCSLSYVLREPANSVRSFYLVLGCKKRHKRRRRSPSIRRIIWKTYAAVENRAIWIDWSSREKKFDKKTKDEQLCTLLAQ